MKNLFNLTFVVAIGYFITGSFSNALLSIDGYAVASWPPSGIALAALLIAGPRAVLGVFLGALITNITHLDSLSNLHWQIALQSVVVSAASTVQACLGYWVVTKVLRMPLDLSDLKLTILGIFICGPVLCVIAALVGTELLIINNVISETGRWENFATWWIGDSIGVMIFTPLLLAGFNFDVARHRFQVIVPSLIIYAMISLTFYLVSNARIEESERAYKSQAQAVIDKFDEALTRVRASTQILASFLTHSQEVSRSEFDGFTAKQMAYNPEVNALVWMPKVPSAQLADFEAQVRQQGVEDYKVFSRFDVEQPRIDHYPVYYGSFSVGLQTVYGLDISAEPYFTSLRASKRSLFVTPAFALESSPTGDLGFLVIAKVPTEGEGVEGYVAAVVSLPLLKESALSNLSYVGVGFELLELGAKSNKTIIDVGAHNGLVAAHQFDMAQRHWQLNIYRQGERLTWTAYWYAQVIGMLFVWLLTTFLIAITGSNIRVRDQVEKQTKVLREQKAKADSANSAKSQFLANMSHEIRTPINGIKGLHYLALQQDDWPTARQYISQADNALSVLLRVLNDLLDFSKMEAGKLDLHQEPIVIVDLCIELKQLIGVEASSKNLIVNYDIADDVEAVFNTDMIRLKQVLLNLMNNAVKFTQHGAIRLKVSDAGDELCFSVTDTGIGIRKEIQSQLFKPFSQADGSTSRRFGGTGLGLSICQKLVSLMGGRIELESEEGLGSCFRVFLPKACALPKRVDSTIKEATGPVDVDLSDVSILLVEDNLLNQHVAKAMLEGKGASPDIANDGIEAIEMISRKQYDIVLMDIQMPNMDGLEATRVIRNELLLSSLTIIGLSANAQDRDLKLAIHYGMDDYVVKPIEADLLFATIARQLKHERKEVQV
ncbi:ATP-binding protein [Pseudoalteromonas sp. SSDWG2]|uniref:ATP-binding protein n=1 Tax=Pseudoalteromonas sp. SSDWG2 TaxID=3139391 RepID=UPI003BAD8467